MKFVHYLEKIATVHHYALASFGIFFLFFLVMLMWVVMADKRALKANSELPLR